MNISRWLPNFPSEKDGLAALLCVKSQNKRAILSLVLKAKAIEPFSAAVDELFLSVAWDQAEYFFNFVVQAQLLVETFDHAWLDVGEEEAVEFVDEQAVIGAERNDFELVNVQAGFR